MSEIELILKSPTDRIAPFTIKCNISWTIKQLKEHIKNIYPLKPTVESQKVIYVGKLLKDDQVLKNLFEPESSTIVHFICQSSINETEKKVDDVINNKQYNREITPEKRPDLYKEYQNYVSNYYASTSQSFGAMNHYQQMMWINQAYLQSYASYCAQFSNRSDSSVPQATDVIVQPPAATSETPQNQENPPNNNERRIDAPAENGVQNMMAAAFGGLMGDGGEDENDGDVEPRDILHYFYILVRFGLLLLICYYYSSVASVVTTLMLFFLFFGVNLIRRNNNHAQPQIIINRRDQQPPPAVDPAQQQQQPIIAESVVNGDEQTGDGAAAAGSNQNVPIEPSRAAEPAANPLPTITERLKRAASTSLQFVLTFFVTLFPEPIAHIDIN